MGLQASIVKSKVREPSENINRDIRSRRALWAVNVLRFIPCWQKTNYI